MNKFFTIVLFALLSSCLSYAFTGPSSGCVGLTYDFHDSLTTGGVWSSSNLAVATIGPGSSGSHATVYAVSAGTTTITYTLGASVTTATFTVYMSLPAIAGIDTLCIGASGSVSNSVSGGIWSSSSTYVATVSSPAGMVTAVHGGTTVINYTLSGYCTAHHSIYVPSSTIDSGLTGANHVCVGSSTTLSTTAMGGMWVSTNTAVATVNASGVVTGISAGADSIKYVVLSGAGGCGTSRSFYKNITVTTSTSSGTISGLSSVAVGASISLSGSVSGGTWSSSNPSIATVNSATGGVTGIAAGTATISYGVSGCSGLAYVTHPVTVTAFNGISGHVNFPGGYCHADVKVWLITYNTSTMNLAAVDSVLIPCTGATSVYYQFLGALTDSYRIKAAVIDTFTVSSTGFIPTYHTSSFYWYAADVLYHLSGTADINQDINMAYGTVTSGAGFVAGNVTAGANKGTTTSVPVSGMMMYIFNSSTLQLIRSVPTDATGHYYFNNLPLGQTYYVFPDSLNYLTTPYTGLTLTAAAPSVSNAAFEQHTLSHTITPVPVAIIDIAADPNVFVFPNPTNGKVNITWTIPSSEEATIVVADITGREVFHSNINMTAGAGVNHIDLSSLTSGLYTISVKSAAVNYNNKIQVQH